MKTATSADARYSVDASLDILHRLLDEESLVLAQLTYVVEHIHAPLLEGCNPMRAAQRGRQPQSSTAPKPPEVLTFAQHWELFANIATLQGAQSVIVSKLEAAVSQSTHLLEQQQQLRWQGTKRSPRIKNSTASGSEEDVGELHTIPELFCSASMRHYMAEHMMYSLNYCRSIAPRVMDLWRLWRCRCCKQASTNLNSEEQQQWQRYHRFLRFLYDLSGESGVPGDPRVVSTRLPDTPATTTRPLHGHAGSISSNNFNTTGGGRLSSVLTQDVPPIPPDWGGFETLLVLLATPLASLRRYMHVARCLIESQCLGRSMRQRLQTEFVDVVALRVAEEGSIMLDELAKQDNAHIMALIDEVAAPAPPGSSEKKYPRIRPDTDGSRTLVHCGRLTKRFRRGRHERLVFLFSDWLCYVEELANGRMRLRASISLEALKVVELDDAAAPEMPHGFDVVTKETRLTFFAPTREQKQQWVDALRSTVKTHEKRVQRCAALQQQSGDVARLMRATAPPLSHNSRLHRQQRADRVRQKRIEHRSMATSTVTKSSLPEASPVSAVSSNSAKKWRFSSSRPPHGSFDVTPWAQQSTDTVHRRVRSTDFLPTSWASPKENSAEEVDTLTVVDASLGAGGGGINTGGLLLSPCDSRKPPRTPMARLLSERFQESSLQPSCNSNASSPKAKDASQANEGEGNERKESGREVGGEEEEEEEGDDRSGHGSANDDKPYEVETIQQQLLLSSAAVVEIEGGINVGSSRSSSSDNRHDGRVEKTVLDESE
ncbi:hypothetical protein DQ04_02341070 [Trypanosoma grayi]|uniref:hypothetical protein n=1 Tax=Trypanosoma grayi TaxID=71804 RepID=UPI0004F460F1|nr:hypothetical protein DQ04_02341070 [Trypanosoma grayi]KEG11722.1 hypothetical protein DQ04_02341070 [Trypanosoma grayi]